MVAADALAILVGQQLAKRVPEKVIRYAAAVSFVVFGACWWRRRSARSPRGLSRGR
jgi:putative Ca2+/H+ antiporter (TMEM165/GDT1 family)